MLLNQRQLEILLELFEKPEVYMTASYFSSKHQCSLRTIQNDIRQIKTELESTNCVIFESTTRKGCRILIQDSSLFSALKDSYYQQFSSATLNYPNGRVNQILHLLLKEHRAISLYDLESAVFVSRSTLLNDLKGVSEVVARYNLELLRSSNKVIIDGSEINKRLCLMDQNLIITNTVAALSEQSSNSSIEKIKNILVETFVSFKHPITEASLNNAIIQLYVALERMQDWFFIEPSDMEIAENLEPEYTISKEIFSRIGKEFFLRIPETEINYFALYMKGQGSFNSSDVISSDVDKLILDALEEIRDQYNIDLTDNLNLRIALSLHTASLIVRIKYNMQLKNHLVDYIKQTFPQGYDLGIYFASHLQKVFHKKVTDDEIAFLAIHLYTALANQHQEGENKKVLVISSMRQSENILLKQTLLNWFSDITSELTFKTPEQIEDKDMDDYDIFLTTERNHYYDAGLAFYVDPFPGQQDYLNLKLAIDGFQSIEDITSIFYKDLYSIGDGKKREKIVENMCQKSSEYFELDGAEFKDAVFQRENMRSTYWGNGIAVPHPLTAVSSDSFVAVTELPQAVVWDDQKNMVNLVLLVCVGKNSSKAFQLWNYLAKVFSDKHFVERLLPDPSYEHFIALLKEAIAGSFQK